MPTMELYAHRLSKNLDFPVGNCRLNTLFKLITITLCCSRIVHSRSMTDFGVVEPKDPFKFVGETLELTCCINNNIVPGDNFSSIFFMHNSSRGESLVSTEYVKILNASAIHLKLPNLEIQDEGTYVCFLKNEDGDSKHIGQQTVKVDYKPGRVKHFACKIYNWEQMKCEWDLGVDFVHPENVNVSVTVNCFKRCPTNCSELTKTSCLLAKWSYHHGYLYNISVTVKTIHNGKFLEEASSQSFTVRTKYSGGNSSGQVLATNVPANVSNLLAKVINSTCVELSWEYPRTSRNKYFVARYFSQWQEGWTNIGVEKNKENRTICVLIPFTKYEFQVAVLPYKVNSTELKNHGEQSSWKKVTAQTLEDVPIAAPDVCPSCYYIFKCSQKPCHKIRIYWKDLTDRDKQGILTQYSISIKSDKMTSRLWNSTIGPLETETSAEFELPDRSIDYELSLTLGTSKGFSKMSSYIYIPVYNKIQPPEDLTVERDLNENGNITFFLNWTPTDEAVESRLNYTEITVLWCYVHKKEEFTCKGDIHWITLSADNKTYVLELGAKNLSSNNFLIGIATKAMDKGKIISSGIHWSSCIYAHNTRPQYVPENVRLSPSHPMNGLTVLWDKFDCAKEKALVMKYQIRYCFTHDKKTCAEPEVLMNVSSSCTEVTLTNLTQDDIILVYISGVTSAGFGPESSQAFSAAVNRSSPGKDLDITYGVIAGAVSMTLLFALICCCCWRYCKQRRKAIPEIKESLAENISPQQNGHYSGRIIRNRHTPQSLEDQVTLQLIPPSESSIQNCPQDLNTLNAGHAPHSRSNNFGNSVFIGKNELSKEGEALLCCQDSMSIDNSFEASAVQRKEEKCKPQNSFTDLHMQDVNATVSTSAREGDMIARKPSTRSISLSDDIPLQASDDSSSDARIDDYIHMNLESNSSVIAPTNWSSQR